MRREVVALDTYDPASGISARAEDLSWAITSRPIWWEQSGYPPPTPHGEHLYDAGCAICKAGAAPWALRVVIDAILNDDSLRQGGMLKVTYPSPAARTSCPTCGSTNPVNRLLMRHGQGRCQDAWHGGRDV